MAQGASEPHHYRLASCEFWEELCLEQKASGLPPLGPKYRRTLVPAGLGTGTANEQGLLGSNGQLWQGQTDRHTLKMGLPFEHQTWRPGKLPTTQQKNRAVRSQGAFLIGPGNINPTGSAHRTTDATWLRRPCAVQRALSVGYSPPMGGARLCSVGVREGTSSPQEEFAPMKPASRTLSTASSPGKAGSQLFSDR